MAKRAKDITINDLNISEQDKKALGYFGIDVDDIVYDKKFFDITDINNNKDYINIPHSGDYCIDLSFEGNADDCVKEFRDKLNDIIGLIVRQNELTLEDTIKFNIYVQSQGYDGFDECADVTYEATESRHEYEMRQLKIKALPSVLKAREAYVKILQEKEEQKKLKEKESFEKELLDLKKKYKID